MDNRTLADLTSVGVKTIADLNLLGIHKVVDLKDCSAEQLYSKLCAITKKKHDICCQDVFQAAIAQAENPALVQEKKKWYYWSKIRKAK